MRQRFHNNINVNRKCTRRGLWNGDICDYAAIWCVLGRSLVKNHIHQIMKAKNIIFQLYGCIQSNGEDI